MGRQWTQKENCDGILESLSPRLAHHSHRLWWSFLNSLSDANMNDKKKLPWEMVVAAAALAIAAIIAAATWLVASTL